MGLMPLPPEEYRTTPEAARAYLAGWVAGTGWKDAEVGRVEQIADYWYLRVNYSEADISEMRRAASDVIWEQHWADTKPADKRQAPVDTVSVPVGAVA